MTMPRTPVLWASVLLLLGLSGLGGVTDAETAPGAVEYCYLDALAFGTAAPATRPAQATLSVATAPRSPRRRVGSVRVVTDESGAVVRRHDFTPYGEELNVTYPNPDRKLFTGQEHDAETGLDYFGARYYRAGIGRFTTVDPVVTWKENLEDPQRWNRYAYVRNNPLRYTDPDGRIIFDWQQFKGYLNEIKNFGKDGYGYVVPTVAAVAAAGSVANDLLLVAGVGEVAQGVRALATKAAKQVSQTALEELPSLTAEQAKNLSRFAKNLPRGNTGVSVDAVGDSVLFTSEVPGKVPGSKAVYQKLVNAEGTTESMPKTTFDPKGAVVHVKDKLTGAIIYP